MPTDLPSAPGDLASLLYRIEALSGPDREVDALIACWTQGWTMHEDSKPAEHEVFAAWMGDPWNSTCTNCSSWPRYTASLDSALALVERLNPAFCWRVQKSGDIARKMGEGPFWATCGLAGEQEAAHAQTAPLALLAALFQSLQHAD